MSTRRSARSAGTGTSTSAACKSLRQRYERVDTTSTEELAIILDDEGRARGPLHFLHIPKNAGSLLDQHSVVGHRSETINYAMSHGDCDPSQPRFNAKCARNPGCGCSAFHIPPRYLSPNVYREHNGLVMCIARDPADKVLSQFKMSNLKRVVKLNNSKTFLVEQAEVYMRKLVAGEPLAPSPFDTSSIYFDFDCHLIAQYEYIWGVDGKRTCDHIIHYSEEEEAEAEAEEGRGVMHDVAALLMSYNISTSVRGKPVNKQAHITLHEITSLSLSDINSSVLDEVRRFYWQDTCLLGYDTAVEPPLAQPQQQQFNSSSSGSSSSSKSISRSSNGRVYARVEGDCGQREEIEKDTIREANEYRKVLSSLTVSLKEKQQHGEKPVEKEKDEEANIDAVLLAPVVSRSCARLKDALGIEEGESLYSKSGLPPGIDLKDVLFVEIPNTVHPFEGDPVRALKELASSSFSSSSSSSSSTTSSSFPPIIVPTEEQLLGGLQYYHNTYCNPNSTLGVNSGDVCTRNPLICSIKGIDDSPCADITKLPPRYFHPNPYRKSKTTGNNRAFTDTTTFAQGTEMHQQRQGVASEADSDTSQQRDEPEKKDTDTDKEAIVVCIVRDPLQRMVNHFKGSRSIWTKEDLFEFTSQIRSNVNTFNNLGTHTLGEFNDWVTRYTQCSLLPQYEYIFDTTGKRTCDYILKFENFDNVTAYIEQYFSAGSRNTNSSSLFADSSININEEVSNMLPIIQFQAHSLYWQDACLFDYNTNIGPELVKCSGCKDSPPKTLHNPYGMCSAPAHVRATLASVNNRIRWVEEEEEEEEKEEKEKEKEKGDKYNIEESGGSRGNNNNNIEKQKRVSSNAAVVLSNSFGADTIQLREKRKPKPKRRNLKSSAFSSVDLIGEEPTKKEDFIKYNNGHNSNMWRAKISNSDSENSDSTLASDNGCDVLKLFFSFDTSNGLVESSPAFVLIAFSILVVVVVYCVPFIAKRRN